MFRVLSAFFFDRDDDRCKTLNDCLPHENGSHSPQTLAKRVSDDSKHFNFRLPKNCRPDFLTIVISFYKFLALFWRAAHFWAFLTSAPSKTTPCRPNITTVQCKKCFSTLCQSLEYFSFFWPQAVLFGFCCLCRLCRLYRLFKQNNDK